MSSRRFAALSRSSQAYVSVVVASGAVTVSSSIYEVVTGQTAWNWLVLAALTLISGSATIKLPSLPATITVSETFVFASVLLFGPAAGTLTVALDALVISFWSYRKGHPLYKIVFNLFALPLTIWIASKLFYLQAGITPLFFEGVDAPPLPVKPLLLPVFSLALLYFSLNSWIIAIAIALETKGSAYRIWRENFAWLSLNYFGGATVSLLLVSYSRNLDYTYLVLILPLIVILYITFSTSMGRVADANQHLTQMNSLYMSTIETLAMAIDAKDQVTHGHIRRVQTYATGLAKQLGVKDAALMAAIEAAALLHDMGKLAIPEYILNKPGPLTPAEFGKMKLHASIGADILSAIAFPYPVVPIVRHHHENWNGTGYPDGIAGVNIPIGARILSVVDCFDALTSDRPYRPRLTDTEAVAILSERRGTMYDPVVVDTFVKAYAELGSSLLSTRGVTSDSPATVIGARVLHTRAAAEHNARSRDEMPTIVRLSPSGANQETLAQAGASLFARVRELVPCSLCVLFVYDAMSDELLAAHATGENASLVVGLRIPMGQKLSGWVAAHRLTIRNSDAVLDFGELAMPFQAPHNSCLSTPMLMGTELVGVLSLYALGRDRFTEEHQRVVELLAAEVAGSILDADKLAAALTAQYFVSNKL